MKFLFITDLHLKDTPPISRKDDYKETILSKLSQVVEMANKLGAYTIIGGDLFSVKEAARVSDSLKRRVMEIFQNFKNPPYLVIGNHDMVYDDLSTIERQPIGLIIQSGVVHWSGAVESLMYGKAADMADEVFSFDDTGINLYLKDYSSPFKTTIKNFKLTENKSVNILASHFNFTANSKMVYSEPAIIYDELMGLNIDILLNGHLHDMNPPIWEKDGKYFVNPGGLARGSISEEDIKRIPSVAMIDIEGKNIKVELIPLKFKPANEVFSLQENIDHKESAEKISKFVADLALVSSSGEEDSFESMLDKMELNSKVIEEVKNYLALGEK